MRGHITHVRIARAFDQRLRIEAEARQVAEAERLRVEAEARQKAEEEERQAIELNQNMSEAYHVLSYILFAQNRVDDAVEAQRRATEVDPFARPWAWGMY